MDRIRIGVAFGVVAFAIAVVAGTLAGARAQDGVARREVPPTPRRWAVVENGVVANVVAWDGVQPWVPPPGAELVDEAVAPNRAEPGGSWDGTRFAPPDRSGEVQAAKDAARAEAIRLTAEADAAAALAATAIGAMRAALLADEARLRAEAAAALGRAR